MLPVLQMLPAQGSRHSGRWAVMVQNSSKVFPPQYLWVIWKHKQKAPTPGWRDPVLRRYTWAEPNNRQEFASKETLRFWTLLFNLASPYSSSVTSQYSTHQGSQGKDWGFAFTGDFFPWLWYREVDLHTQRRERDLIKITSWQDRSGRFCFYHFKWGNRCSIQCLYRVV